MGFMHKWDVRKLIEKLAEVHAREQKPNFKVENLIEDPSMVGHG